MATELEKTMRDAVLIGTGILFNGQRIDPLDIYFEPEKQYEPRVSLEAALLQEIVELRAENSNLLAANRDCVDHYEDARADILRLQEVVNTQAESLRLVQSGGEAEVTIDVLRAELAKLKAQDLDKVVMLELEVAALRSLLDESESSFLTAGAQGHTREQIGLQLDDRREGLDAHHVYCRAVTEDV